MVFSREEYIKSMNGKAYFGNRGRFDTGYHGLGDPDDKTLLDFEKKVIIPNFERDIIARNYCYGENEEYGKCRHDSHFYNRFYVCSQPKRRLNNCIKHWQNKIDVRDQATAEYLEERRIFRITGLNKEERERAKAPSQPSIVDKIRSFILKEEEMKQYEENYKSRYG